MSATTLAGVLRVLRAQGVKNGMVGAYRVSWRLGAFGWVINYDKGIVATIEE